MPVFHLLSRSSLSFWELPSLPSQSFSSFLLEQTLIFLLRKRRSFNFADLISRTALMISLISRHWKIVAFDWLTQFLHWWRLVTFIYAAINSSGAHPPPPGQPRGICSRCQSRGGALANFIAARGLGISIPRGEPPGIWHRCFRKMDEFIGKDEAFVKDWLVRQGLEKPVDLLNKGMFSQF